MKYYPLDVWLERPSTRLIRALRFFDWCTANDLFDAMDMAADDTEARRTMRGMLTKMVNCRYVERQSGMFRLTAQGRIAATEPHRWTVAA